MSSEPTCAPSLSSGPSKLGLRKSDSHQQKLHVSTRHQANQVCVMQWFTRGADVGGPGANGCEPIGWICAPQGRTRTFRANHTTFQLPSGLVPNLSGVRDPTGPATGRRSHGPWIYCRFSGRANRMGRFVPLSGGARRDLRGAANSRLCHLSSHPLHP